MRAVPPPQPSRRDQPMNRLAAPAERSAETRGSLSLAARLYEYASRRGMRLVEHQGLYEIAWSRGALRYFIEIDKATAAVRSGTYEKPGARTRYHSNPTYLGAAPLEELLEQQREAAEADHGL